MAVFGEDICMAVFGGGFWWATILCGRLNFSERRLYKIVAH